MLRPHLTLTAATFALLLGNAAVAKLPPLSDEAKAKAVEAAAKTAWSDKLAGFQLCKSQDRAAANFANQAKQTGKEAKPPTATAPCTDPGPFVLASAASAASAPATAATAKPLEAAGAHSPATTAAVPPSGKATTAELQGQPKK